MTNAKTKTVARNNPYLYSEIDNMLESEGDVIIRFTPALEPDPWAPDYGQGAVLCYAVGEEMQTISDQFGRIRK